MKNVKKVSFCGNRATSLLQTRYVDQWYQYRNEIPKSTGYYKELSVNILFTDAEICEISAESAETVA
jgi:hypothetical protein